VCNDHTNETNAERRKSRERAEWFRRLHNMQISELVQCLLKSAAKKPVLTKTASSDDALRKRAVALQDPRGCDNGNTCTELH
jgi:hypothetical protein